MGARKQSTPQYGARVPHREKRDCIVVVRPSGQCYLTLPSADDDSNLLVQ